MNMQRTEALSGSIAANSHLGALSTLPEFLDTVGELTLRDRRRIIDQAMVLIEQAYVHLPLKRAMHAIDPVQALRLLRRRLDREDDALSERDFHNEMIEIFKSLRDLHTNLHSAHAL